MARIAFVTGMDAAPWGGSEVLWSQAAGHLADAGHEVMASVPWWPSIVPPLAAVAQRGVVLDRRKQATLGRRAWARGWRTILGKPGWSPAWQRIERFRPDLVCVSHGATTCGIDWMKLCFQERIPFVTICQANYEFWWPSDALSDVYRAVFQAARKVFFVSRRNRELFETQLGTPLPAAQVVWNPCGVSWDAEPSWPASDRVWRLACVARLEPRAKGQDLLFEVLSRDKWRRRPVTLSLCGTGPWEACLRRLVAAYGVGDVVRFAGHVADVEGIWREHHALALPSRYEGLPLSLVEAMLCGRPSIVTDVAGNTEVVDDGVTGFVASAPTVALLDEALERAWARRDEWRQIGRRAAVAIREKLPRDPARLLADDILGVAAAPSAERRDFAS